MGVIYMAYANNETLDNLILGAVASIEQGTPASYLTLMIKQTPTYILKADPAHKETRFRPQSQLVTYTGITKDGQLIIETYNGGVTALADDSVILTNDKPITYPEGHELQGTPVKGTYDNDGIFTVDQKNGKDTLRNEYVSAVKWVKDNYGVTATTEWKVGFKLKPSYIMQIPSDLEKVVIKISNGREETREGGDYVVIDSKEGKVNSVHAIEKKWLADTYVTIEEYNKSHK